MTETPDTALERLRALVGELRLRGLAAVLDEELARFEKHPGSVTELLHRLLLEEARFRRERSLEHRLSEAHLPWPWTLETFPFERQPGVERTQLHSLAGLGFLGRAENLVFIGNPGTGKTGLAIALARQACLAGHRARFYSAQDLLDELYASLADRSTARLLKRLARYSPLIIDELGYLTLRPEQTNAFFKLMDQRYGRVSTIITTNLDYEAWYELFEKKPLVDALLDRLQHHCITLRIEGPSLRAPPPTAPEGEPPGTAKKRTPKRS